MELSYWMVNKDDWFALTPEQKKQEVSDALGELLSIAKRKHFLHNGDQRGSIPLRKKELDTYLLDILKWEQETL